MTRPEFGFLTTGQQSSVYHAIKRRGSTFRDQARKYGVPMAIIERIVDHKFALERERSRDYCDSLPGSQVNA